MRAGRPGSHRRQDVANIRKYRGRWVAQVRRKGIAPRCKSFDTKADAEKWARQLEAEVDRCGTLPDTRVAASTTVAQIIKRYQKEITPLKRSAKSEHQRLNALLRRPIVHRTLTQLSSNDIANYRDDRLKAVGPATVIRELNTLSHCIDIARKEWGIIIYDNPCKLVRRPVAPKGRNRRLRAGEEQKLLDAADNGRNPHMRAIIIFAIETAMRRGEIVNLIWEHVDLERRVAHLPMTKNGEPRDVPLSSRAVAAMTSSDRPREGKVFPVSETAVFQAWDHLRGRAGVPDLHFHDLRHEAVSRLFERGFNVVEVSTISGHKELRMLARYTHLRADDLVARLG